MDWRPVGGQLLPAISRDPALVVGDLLADAGGLQLDRGATGLCRIAGAWVCRNPARRRWQDAVLHLVLGSNVGSRRPIVRAGGALPGDRAGVRYRTGIQHGVWDSGAASVCGAVRRDCAGSGGAGGDPRGSRLPWSDCGERCRRADKGARTDGKRMWKRRRLHAARVSICLGGGFWSRRLRGL
jgi:hypothetical protein